jgi:DNA-binding NarL/FixJ family response regulator
VNLEASCLGSGRATLNYPIPRIRKGVRVSKVSVLLADDNSAVLGQVTKALEKDYEIVAAVKDGQAVIKECLRLKPNVVVLDISMGDVNGLDLAQELRDAGCNSKIVFLTVHEDYDYVNAAIGVGAMAYVVKSHMSTDLSVAIKAALADRFFVSSSLLYERS